MGFNFIVSIGYLGAMAGLTDMSSPDNNVGINIVWIFGLEGIIAAICAYSFAKLSRVHNNDSNGAAYVYTRTAFGRFAGYFVGFMLYVVMPFVIAEQIMTLIRGMLDPQYGNNLMHENFLGSFTDLYLDLIGIVIYGIAASVVFFGIKFYKKTAVRAGIIKWVTSGILIVAGLVLCIIHGKENYAGWFKSTENGGWSHLSFSGFMSAFTACFFYFAGFEQVVVSTKNIENVEKNLSKGLLIVMAIMSIFYIVITFIFFGAVAGGVSDVDNQWSQNMNISTWQLFTKNEKPIFWLEIVGIVIMFTSQLALKIQIATMNGFIGGAMLQPLAVEGYIPEKYGNLTKENIPANGVKLNMIFTVVCILLWLIIPDIINGILNSQGKGVIPFNINQLTAASSVIVLFIYAMVLAATMFQWYKRNIKLKVWELIAFPVVFFVVIIFFVYHYYQIISNIVNYIPELSKGIISSKHLQSLIGAIIEIVFVILAVTFAISNYKFYYMPKLKKRLAENPDLQKKLDDIFVIKESEEEKVVEELEPQTSI